MKLSPQAYTALRGSMLCSAVVAMAELQESGRAHTLFIDGFWSACEGCEHLSSISSL